MQANVNSKKIHPVKSSQSEVFVKDKQFNRVKELLSRGVEEVIDRKTLEKQLLSGKKLRIKIGIDPTGSKIHIGRAIPLWRLRDFQELGHQIVLIIGDFTAQIGDASDKQAMRKRLSEQEIKENLKNYTKQIGRILDMDKVELRYNSEWFKKMNIKDLLSLAMNFTVQQMIHRRNFKERWEQGKPIGLHEVDYPLLQGLDSKAVKADVEIGGFDQLFNLKAGREIQKIFGQKSQDIMTLKMLFGLDGRKMSTSWGNVINITDEPKEQFGKIMSMKDELILDYFELCTRMPLREIKQIEKEMRLKKVNPKEAKMKLAQEVVSLYHGKKEAIRAEQEFERVFKEKKLPAKIPETRIIKEKSLNLLDLLKKTNIASSKAEAKRLILQSGIKIDGEVQKDWRRRIRIKKGMLIQAGKRRFLKLI